MSALLWLLRLGLGALLVASGALKLGDPAAFAAEIANYHLLPALSPLLAVTLPPVELVLGLALLAGPRPWLRAAALAATLVLTVFTVAVTSVVARGINVDCGCFGSAASPVTLLTVLRDLALVAAAVAIYMLTTRAPTAPPPPAPA
jgi:putative oxidoreductase